MSGRAAARRLVAAGALAVGASGWLTACAEAPTASEPFSLAFTLPFPVVVAGDTLRDTSGTAVPLTAQVFGGDGQPIPDAEFRFLATQGFARVVAGDFVIGDSAGRTARLVAIGAGIQSLPQDLQVVAVAPDSIALVTTEPGVLAYLPIQRPTFFPADTSERIVARVLQVPAADAPANVRGWPVAYDVELYAGDQLVPDSDSLAYPIDPTTRLPSAIAVTGSDGTVARQIRIDLREGRPLPPAGIDALDSAVVFVRILGRPPGTLRQQAVRVTVPITTR